MTQQRWKVFTALVWDTFQEARARWLFWGLFGLSTLLVAIFLFVLQVDLVQGAVSLMGIPATARHIFRIEKFVRVSYSWVSIALYLWGTFLAVFASAGLMPSVLEPGRISLLLSKPLTRTMLLAGRFAGNILIVAVNHVYLVGSVWVIIGVKTRIWDPRFLLAIPISLFMFAVLLCVVMLTGVVFESAALSVMLPVAIMLISALLAQRDVVVRLLSSEWSRELWVALYWILPKFYDLGLGMRRFILADQPADWWTLIWTSAAFGMGILSGAIFVFRKRDF